MAKTINWKSLVNAADKDRNAKVKVYETRHPKYERPLRPGQQYPGVPNDA